jgi:hypothetical protein
MAKAKYTKQKNGYFQARVWDGSYVDGKKHYIAVLHGKQKCSLDTEPHVAFQRRIELRRNWNLPESVLRFRFFDARLSGIIELD